MPRNYRRSHSILSSPITMFVVIIVLIFLVRAGAKISSKSNQSAIKLSEVESNLAKLEMSKARLTVEIQNISTESGIEKEIREKYHAVGPGESVAVIVNSDENPASVSVIATTSGHSVDSWWRRLLQGIGL